VLCSDSADSLPIESIPEYTAREEFEDSKRWRVVQIGDKSYRIDMEAIDPYKKVLSHGGKSYGIEPVACLTCSLF